MVLPDGGRCSFLLSEMKAETLRHDVAKCRKRVGGKLCDTMSQSAGSVLSENFTTRCRKVQEICWGKTLRHDVAK